MNKKEQRTGLLAQARAIAEKVKAEGRGFTQQETSDFEGLIAQVDAIDVDLKKEAESKERFERIASFGPIDDDRYAGEVKGFVTVDGQKMAEKMLSTEFGRHNVKSLVAEGSSVVPVQMLSSSPVEEGKPASGLLQVLPAMQTSVEFAYLRQTTRTNNAAPVARGALKPTSTYEIDRVEDRLRVIAHLAAPVDQYWLMDNQSLTQFIQNELLYGLFLEVEAQILHGAGTGENLRGLTTTSGVQTQAFATSPVVTIRRAMNAVETVGYTPGAIVLHPTDWTSIEITQTTTGAFLLGDGPAGAPLDPVARRLWGVPVVTTLAATQGEAVVIAKDAATVMLDTHGINIAWGLPGESFAKNEVVARCEGRFGLAVPRPLGVVLADLTA